MGGGRPGHPPPYRPRGSRRSDRGSESGLRPHGSAGMRSLIEGFGITWPTYGDWISAAVAAGAVAALWFLAHLAGKLLGPRLAAFWARRAGGRGEELVPHLCGLVRYFTAAILIAILLNLDSWRPLGAIVLGIALASAAA